MATTQNQVNRVALAPYKKALSKHLRGLLVTKGKSYADIASALAARGVLLTENNLRYKVSRGEMPADLFILIMRIIAAEPSTIVRIVNSAEGTPQ